MRSVISHLVAACLALHTLLGCCVHHAHADTTCERCVHFSHDDAAHDDVAECDYAHHGAAHHEHDALEAETAAAPTATHRHDEHEKPCSGSCGEKCQFVSTVRVQLENPVVWLDLASTHVDVVAIEADTSWIRGDAWLTAPPPLPLRLHLWNGLLLI